MFLIRKTANTAPLRLPDLNRPFIAQTDASDYGFGDILLQEHPEGLYLVAFASHTLSPTARNYSATERKHWRQCSHCTVLISLWMESHSLFGLITKPLRG